MAMQRSFHHSLLFVTLIIRVVPRLLASTVL